MFAALSALSDDDKNEWETAGGQPRKKGERRKVKQPESPEEIARKQKITELKQKLSQIEAAEIKAAMNTGGLKKEQKKLVAMKPEVLKQLSELGANSNADPADNHQKLVLAQQRERDQQRAEPAAQRENQQPWAQLKAEEKVQELRALGFFEEQAKEAVERFGSVADVNALLELVVEDRRKQEAAVPPPMSAAPDPVALHTATVTEQFHRQNRQLLQQHQQQLQDLQLKQQRELAQLQRAFEEQIRQGPQQQQPREEWEQQPEHQRKQEKKQEKKQQQQQQQQPQPQKQQQQQPKQTQQQFQQPKPHKQVKAKAAAKSPGASPQIHSTPYEALRHADKPLTLRNTERSPVLAPDQSGVMVYRPAAFEKTRELELRNMERELTVIEANELKWKQGRLKVSAAQLHEITTKHQLERRILDLKQELGLEPLPPPSYDASTAATPAPSSSSSSSADAAHASSAHAASSSLEGHVVSPVEEHQLEAEEAALHQAVLHHTHLHKALQPWSTSL